MVVKVVVIKVGAQQRVEPLHFVPNRHWYLDTGRLGGYLSTITTYVVKIIDDYFPNQLSPKNSSTLKIDTDTH